MLNHAVIEYLASLKYQADAERRVCWLPLGGIYWVDEIPSFKTLLGLGEADRTQIYQLFSIRFKIWNREEVSTEQREFWEYAKHELPACPLFQRLTLTEDDRQAQSAVEQEFAAAFEYLISKAEVAVLEEVAEGVNSFSLTYDLTKNPANEENQS